jgi:hypothetical protein
MRAKFINLNEQDRAAFRAVHAFLTGRLEERGAVDWALQLNTNDIVKRLAILEIIDRADGKIKEPWLSAWRLIEEYWDSPLVPSRHSSTDVYNVKRRLANGDRSNTLIQAVVELVVPRLKVTAFTSSDIERRQLSKRPKNVKDLFSLGLKSGSVIDPETLQLERVREDKFLVSLANALDAAVNTGLDITKRIYGDQNRRDWHFGFVYRVYFVPPDERADREDEPDEFHQGMAPSVKLLHAIVSQLAVVDLSKATEFVRRWKLTDSLIHRRLWAAFAKDSRFATSEEVAEFLGSMEKQQFWNLQGLPEVIELRARRFIDFSASEKIAITGQIRRLPPMSLWPKDTDPVLLKNARLYWGVRELRRLELGGGVLSESDRKWLAAKIVNFPELNEMTDVRWGFAGTTRVRVLTPKPDNSFDLTSGQPRLVALEIALSSERSGWNDDPSERASAWIHQLGNAAKILEDLESVNGGGNAYRNVWQRFGWAHTPIRNGDANESRETLLQEANRVLQLIEMLPDETIAFAINALCAWLSAWEKENVDLSRLLPIWLKLWPIAVDETNEISTSEETEINEVVKPEDGDYPRGLDTLNTSTGKLVGVFLANCPTLKDEKNLFASNAELLTMRDEIATTEGRAGLISRLRLIESLPYFWLAMPDWTSKNLLEKLKENTPEARALWRAVSRRTQFYEILKIIGVMMADRITDPLLGRDAKKSFLFSLVIECLHAFQQKRDPAVSYPRIQQVIRSAEDEVRAHGADAIGRFVRDVPASSKEDLFRQAVIPFFQKVWPKDLSLVTPGISKALADLPASSNAAFVEAVDVIEPYLVPFECWSMADYGLYGDEDGSPKIAQVDSYAKASALLKLLNLTIGTAEGSVVPYDLPEVLDQVRGIAPQLAGSQIFRRLATAARRG